MSRFLIGLSFCCAVALSASPAPLSAQAPARRVTETALDRYVNAADSSYGYSLIETRPGEGHTAYVLEVISQTWLTAKEVDKPAWRHWLTIIKPDTVAHGTGFVFVTGGDTRRKPPARVGRRTHRHRRDHAVGGRRVADGPRTSRSSLAGRQGAHRGRPDRLHVGQVPAHRRRALAARLPMTKSVVRAMDAVTDFCGKPEQGAPQGRSLRRRRGVEARLDDVGHGGGRSARGRDRADGDRRAERRAVVHPPLAGIRILGARGEGLRGPGDHEVDADAAEPRAARASRIRTSTAIA